jgi:hypothetical protein
VIGWGIKRFAAVQDGSGIVSGVVKEAGEDAKEKYGKIGGQGA